MIGYLGPQGTYSEKAAILYSKDMERVEYQSIDDVISAVDNESIEVGIVPIENSIEGSVNATMDRFIFTSDVKIIGEVVISIAHDLLVSKNYNGEKINKILSHTQALGQCRGFLNSNFNGVQQEVTSSTAEAARQVAVSNESWAAIGNPLCADIYGLKVLRKAIQDNKDNETRFVVISKRAKEEFVQNCKTALAFGINHEPGALARVLDILALWDINMNKIISRPIKNCIGEYAFFVEVEGHISEENLYNAVKMLQRKTAFCKFLGSYPVCARV